MKRILYIIIAFLLLQSQCYGFMVIGSGMVETPSGTTPDYQWDLEDNAADRIVVATSGTDGTLLETNTSVVAISAGCLDGGCFDLSLASVETTRLNLVLPQSSYSDNSLTIQVAFKFSAAIDQYIRLAQGNSGSNVLMLQHVSGTNNINFYFRGNNIGALSFDTLNTGSWQVLRFVVDSAGTVTAYQGETELSLAQKDQITGITFGSGVGNDPFSFAVYGNGSTTQGYSYLNAVVDQVRIWNEAVTP